MVAAEINRGGSGQVYTDNQVHISGTGNFIQLGDAGLDAPSSAVARRKLVETVNAARMAAGKPTLAELAAKVGCSPALLSRLFNGHHVPNKNVLLRLAEALAVDPSIVMGKWVPLWEVAGRKEPSRAGTTTPATDLTGQESPTPAGFECPECGAWVVNPARHITWHVQGATDDTTRQVRADGGEPGNAQVVPLRKVT
ncbi:helix-turn-helix domain-containing protein [Micromonospora carbonacea]|uniref:helix-turn-helix domain-containing protein n=1 Tax=Micromonospora carbonacea TaxID=47853 RepID=UPI003D7028E8